MQRPLEGIRVLDFSTMIVGPMATQYLGDMGADVIKIEPPEGDLTRSIGPRHSPKMGAFFLNANRNKRSLVLDLKVPETRDVLHSLVKSSDVVLHSIRTAAAEGIGLSYAALSAINPKLIYCHVAGFSDHGLLGGKPAYDDVAQAQSGIAMLQAVITGQPRYVPSILGDKITAVHAAMAVLAAVCHRLRTGVGQEVKVPMFETMVAFNMVEHLWGETFQPPLGGPGYEPIATGARRPFETKDGKYLCVLPYTDIHWRKFCAVVSDPALTSDPRFINHAARQSDQIGFWAEVGRQVEKRTKAEWVAALTDADVPFGEVNSLEDLLHDPHLDSVDFWKMTEHPTEGRLRMPANPMSMSASPLSVYAHAPSLGEHNQEVLGDLGFSAADIDGLAEAGAFGTSAKPSRQSVA